LFSQATDCNLQSGWLVKENTDCTDLRIFYLCLLYMMDNVLLEYTYADTLEPITTSEEDYDAETENDENDEKPQNFKGYDLTDFDQKVIIGNFKLPHNKAPQIFSFLVKKTGGLIFLTLENGEKKEKNEHLHFAIANSKITPDTLKTYIRKQFPELIQKQKGGDKKYLATYAKTLPYQVLYIFKERNENFFSNIDEVNDDKKLHIQHYANEFDQMKTKFSKSPAGQFYEYFCKRGGKKLVGDKIHQIPLGSHANDNMTLRASISSIAVEWALETDNPNPGFPLILKLVNYTQLKIDKYGYQEYIASKFHKEY